MRQEHIHKAAFFSVSACLLFAILGACVKAANDTVSNELIVFLRNLFGFLALLPILIHSGIGSLKTTVPGLHVIRTLSGLAAMYCFFYALGKINLSDAVLLSYTTPLFAPIIAIYWLRERFAPRIGVALIIGFIGVSFILKPSGESLINQAAWIALASGFFAAIANTVIRKMRSTEPTTRVVFYYSLGCTLLSLPLGLISWQPLTGNEILLLVGAGVSATAGQLCLTKAYAYAPVARIGPFVYFTVVFAAIMGWLFWLEFPDVFSAIGTMLVICAGVLALQKSNTKKTGGLDKTPV